ncbi:MAG: hypothetical protein AAF267_06060 [Deinococcota bacterium]
MQVSGYATQATDKLNARNTYAGRSYHPANASNIAKQVNNLEALS